MIKIKKNSLGPAAVLIVLSVLVFVLISMMLSLVAADVCPAVKVIAGIVLVGGMGFCTHFAYSLAHDVFVIVKNDNPLDKPIDLDQLHGEAPRIDDEE